MKDEVYTPEDTIKISNLRQERWALLAEFASRPNLKRDTQGHHDRMRRRMIDIEKELYRLTGKEIYRHG